MTFIPDNDREERMVAEEEGGSDEQRRQREGRWGEAAAPTRYVINFRDPGARCVPWTRESESLTTISA